MGPSALIGVFALVAIEFALNGGSLGGGAVAPPDPTFKARLERGGCYGSCPAYVVTIHADGHVDFVGGRSVVEPSVRCQGKREWQVSPTAVARLRSLIDQAGFYRLKAEYRAPITDQSASTVTITRRGRTKTVVDYFGLMVGMPKSMVTLENATDAAADTKACVVPSPAARGL